MRRSLLTTIVLTTVLSGGFVVLDETGAGVPPDDVVEERVNANLMRIRVNGEWEDVPMVPLADHLCQSQRRLFERYCTDELLAPETEH